MSSHGYLGDPPPLGSHGPKFSWKCARLGCKYETVAWTENGIRVSKEYHLNKHLADDRDTLDAFKIRAMVKPMEDYNILTLTWQDILFLKHRGISIDEQVVYDPKLKPRPTNDEMTPGLWVRVLERVLARIRGENGDSSKPKLRETRDHCD